MKTFTYALIILGALVVLVTIAVQVFFRLPLPDYQGTVELEGLRSDVEVRFDAYGIPHVFAQNDEDLFFAQGYITARERMFQMDMTRLAGRGELSTLFGEGTGGTDALMKTVGFYRLAGAEMRQLSQPCKDIILAYTRGVNAYLDTVRHLPREYFFLRARPEPWVPEDTVVCGTLMAYSLSRSKQADLVLYRIGETGGEDILKHIIPSYPEFAPTVSGSDDQQYAASDDVLFVPFPSRSLRQIGPNPFSGRNEFAASNWMIFSGSLTTTGAPLLTGSPDLQPKIPALFYLIHLKSVAYDVIGGSLPGTPGVSAVGFNGSIAWSMVNGRVDEIDYFIERINPDNPDQYLTETGYEDFQIVEETLKIKTKEGIREEELKIKVSRHGPIISEVMPLAPDNTAMMWVGMKPTGILPGFRELNKASSFDAFRAALRHVKTPSVNVGYADAEGNIGYQYAGSPPRRKKGSGVLPVPGWAGEYDWQGTVPFQRLPHDLNPSKGYLGAFNNPGRRTEDHLTNYYLFERALRFEELATGFEDMTVEEARSVQLDTVSVVAKRWVPHILQAGKKTEDLAEALTLFEGWDGSIRRTSPAATLFVAFYSRMMQNTLADEVGALLWEEYLSQSYLLYIPDLVLTRIADQDGHVLYDDVRTTHLKETRDDIIEKSLREAVDELTERLGDKPKEWEWGKVHRMAFAHPLGAKLPFFNLRPIPTHGDTFTINAGMWDNQNPYEMESGGVIRLVVDFSDVEHVTIICPPGQSGHFMSPHYDDSAEMWAAGEQIPMHFLSGKELPKVLVLRKKPELP